MTHGETILLFIVVAVFVFSAFGMQRTTLLLARAANTPQQVTAILLPKWFPLVWLFIFAKYGILIYVAIYWSWGVAISLFVGEFVLSSILPIPSRLYFPIFRRRIEQIKNEHYGLGTSLEGFLDAAEAEGFYWGR